MITSKLWEWVLLAPGRKILEKTKKVLPKKWVDSAPESKTHGILSKKKKKAFSTRTKLTGKKMAQTRLNLYVQNRKNILNVSTFYVCCTHRTL